MVMTHRPAQEIDYSASEPGPVALSIVDWVGKRFAHLRKPLLQGANFAGRFRFIAADGMRGHRREIVQIVALDASSALAQGGLVWLVSLVASYLDSGTPQRVFGLFDFSLHDQTTTVLTLTVAVGSILLFTTLATYRVTLLSRRLARAHNLHCTQQFLQIMQEAPVVVDQPIPFGEDVVLYNLRRNPVQIGIVTERIIMAVQPACRSLVLFGLLFVLDPLASLVFSALFVVCLPFFYKVAIGINVDTKTYYLLLNRYYKKAVDIFYGLYWSVTTRRAAQASIDILMDDRITTEFFDANDRFHLSDDRMRLATGLFKSVFVTFAILLFSYLAVTDQRSWGELVAFFAGMMMLANSVQTLGGYGALLVRFYPQVSEYLDFMKDIQRRTRQARRRGSGQESLPDRFDIRVNAPKVDGSLTQATIRKDGITLLIHGVRPTKLYFDRFIGPVIRATDTDAQAWARCRFISAQYRFYPISLQQNLEAGHSDAQTARRLDALLETLGLRQEIADLPRGAATIVTEDLWAGFSNTLKLACRIAPLLAIGDDPVMLDCDLVSGVDADVARSALAFLGQSHVFLFSSRPAQVDLDIALALVVDGDAVIGAGDKGWYAAVRPTLATLLQHGAVITGDETHLLET